MKSLKLYEKPNDNNNKRLYDSSYHIAPHAGLDLLSSIRLARLSD